MTVAHRAAAAAALALSLTAPAAHGAAGDLDPSFGGDGIVQVQPGPDRSSLHALALSGDRLVAVGGAGSTGAGCYDPALVRLLTDGTPDPAFGTGGLTTGATFPCGEFGHFATALAVAVAPDGAVITGGDAGGRELDNDGEIVAAQTPAGSPDPAFGGGDGFVDHGDYFHGNVNDVVRLPDGRIAAVGAHYGLRSAWGLSRYEADGDRDASYGDGTGFVRHRPLDASGSLQAAVADGTDGALVVAGVLYGNEADTPVIARVRADGALDPDFGEAGLALETTDGWLNDLAATSDGGFVATGSGGPEGLVTRVDAGGDRDETFGAMGRVDAGIAFPRAIAVDPAGRIVVAGTDASSRFAVARLLPNGARDDTFGGADGLVTLAVPTDPFENPGASDVVVQPDGRIVVGGTALLDGRPAFTVARLLADGGDAPAPPGGEDGTGSSDGEIGTGPDGGPVGSGPVANRQGGSRGRVSIRILGSRVTKRGVLVRVTWPRGTEGAARARLWTRNKGVLLGRRTVVVLKGTTSRRFRVPLNRRAKRMLRSGKRLPVRATVRVSGLPGR